MKKQIYLVQSKSDDYGACILELVETTAVNAKEYYYHKLVSKADAEILKKYISLINFEEESERSNEQRYYGHD